MPLFLVKGQIAKSFVAGMRAGTTTAAAHERALQRAAASLGGLLVRLHLVAGNWDPFALFDLPIEATTPMMLAILSSGLFEPGETRLALTLNAKQVVESIAPSGAMESPWGEVAGALFAVTATFNAEGVAALAASSAEQFEANLAADATQLGGHLRKLLLIAGTYAVTAILDLPHGHAPGAMILKLLSSRMVEQGAQITRLLTCAEIDAGGERFRQAMKSD